MLHSLQRALDTVLRTAASDPIGQSRIARGRCGLAAHGSRIIPTIKVARPGQGDGSGLKRRRNCVQHHATAAKEPPMRQPRLLAATLFAVDVSIMPAGAAEPPTLIPDTKAIAERLQPAGTLAPRRPEPRPDLAQRLRRWQTGGPVRNFVLSRHGNGDEHGGPSRALRAPAGRDRAVPSTRRRGSDAAPGGRAGNRG